MFIQPRKYIKLLVMFELMFPQLKINGTPFKFHFQHLVLRLLVYTNSTNISLLINKSKYYLSI